jgi:hypothetical protein
MADPDAAIIFPKGDIEHPMELVFDAPMIPDGRGDAAGAGPQHGSSRLVKAAQSDEPASESMRPSENALVSIKHPQYPAPATPNADSPLMRLPCRVAAGSN